MKKTEINNCKIVRCIYIANKWKVVVEHNDKIYGFRIDGSVEDTDADVSVKIYNQLLLTELQVSPEPTVTPSKGTLIDTTPIEKQ